MTVQQGTPESAVLVAIDVSKLRHDVLIEAPGWRSDKRLIVPNSAGEFRHFAEYLHSLDRPVHVAFEATGDYHRGLAHFLLGRDFSYIWFPAWRSHAREKRYITRGIRMIPRMLRSSSTCFAAAWYSTTMTLWRRG